MKVGIISVYHTENCGSVLQATALANKLKDLNQDVYFISTKNKYSAHSLKSITKSSIKYMLKGKNIFPPIKKYKYYDRYIKENFKVARGNEKFDLVVIGSDTIWDVDSRYFLESQDIFWARDMDGKIISYAASIANSSYDKLDSLGYPIQCLKKYNSISVRDEYTKEYIESRLKKKVNKVCDPTFLYTKEEYEERLKKDIDTKYVLLYLFNEPSEKESELIKRFSKENDFKIVCLTGVDKNISIADEKVESTIDNFLTYYKNASYVITNTFHGTIFSIIFNKKFIVLDCGKNKITNLLKQFDLENRIVSRDNNIIDVLKEDIDYKKVNKEIEKIREESIQYLKDNLV